MSLSSYGASVKDSIDIHQVTFRILVMGYTSYLEEVSNRSIRRAVNGVILTRWIFPSSYHVHISRLEELKRLEVTERVLNELK
jgi:hypothetical protein